jgi:hypothetical protein
VAFVNEAAESDWSGVHGFGINSPGRKIRGILTMGEEEFIGPLRRLCRCVSVCI